MSNISAIDSGKTSDGLFMFLVQNPVQEFQIIPEMIYPLMAEKASVKIVRDDNKSILFSSGTFLNYILSWADEHGIERTDLCSSYICQAIEEKMSEPTSVDHEYEKNYQWSEMSVYLL